MIYTGLSEQEVTDSRRVHGQNSTPTSEKHHLLSIIKEIVSEPLFILLLITASIYFTTANFRDGSIMLCALFFVAGISLFQERRSRNALKLLKDFSEPLCTVIRNGEEKNILSQEIVAGDIIVLNDGEIISADATVLEAHDFAVDQSILTGESFAIIKSADEHADNKVFKGTSVLSGRCLARVTRVGDQTELGKLGKLIVGVENTKTPLQIQIGKFTAQMVGFGVVAFLGIVLYSFYQSNNWLTSIIRGLTLAMSVLPEEIPVAFSTFMALGAFYLIKRGVIAKSPFTVETLGGATTICVDKTGTITQNKMEIACLYDYKSDLLWQTGEGTASYVSVLELSMWASEPTAVDPMERSIHELYEKLAPVDQRTGADLIHEYPLSGELPIMTHTFALSDGTMITATKGSLEHLLRQCDLDTKEKIRIQGLAEAITIKGYRVLGVGSASDQQHQEELTHSELRFNFAGFIAFYDPPKENMKLVIENFYKAGIQIKMITGDHGSTAASIASMVGIKNPGKVLNGTDIMAMDDRELEKRIIEFNIFARVFPEAKLRIVQAFMKSGEIVAMTGDGVNDAPALKAAHIGVAMGRGSAVAHASAGLILPDDNLHWMTEAILLGRKIYTNLRNAFRYIISIHIPVILLVAVPILLAWDVNNIFLPIHVIFLELIMGPTCSIIYENEPAASNIMEQPPRKRNESLFSVSELSVSVLQGLMIAVVSLSVCYLSIASGDSPEKVRTITYATLIWCNIFLTLENRSFQLPVFKTIWLRNPLMPLILFASIVVLLLSVYVKPVQELFGFTALTGHEFIVSILWAAAGVFWIDFYKIIKMKA